MAKPVVDGIERDLAGQAAVLRISVRDSAGAKLATQFGVRAVPTLLVWRDGEAVLRAVGSIDSEAVVRAAAP